MCIFILSNVWLVLKSQPLLRTKHPYDPYDTIQLSVIILMIQLSIGILMMSIVILMIRYSCESLYLWYDTAVDRYTYDTIQLSIVILMVSIVILIIRYSFRSLYLWYDTAFDHCNYHKDVLLMIRYSCRSLYLWYDTAVDHCNYHNDVSLIIRYSFPSSSVVTSYMECSHVRSDPSFSEIPPIFTSFLSTWHNLFMKLCAWDINLNLLFKNLIFICWFLIYFTSWKKSICRNTTMNT